MYAVLGAPIRHSLSPQIFKLFAAQFQQSLNYQAIEVEPESLAATLKMLHQQGYKGVNLTSPLKEKAFSLATTLSEQARAAGAVNILRFQEDGSYEGHNSDGLGLIRDLVETKKMAIQNKKVLVLGAGGAVRGVLPALLQEKPHAVVISNRTEARARQLIASFQNSSVPLYFSTWQQLSGQFDLVIHGTTLGFYKERPFISSQILSKTTCCYDLSYGKAALPFLTWAHEQGLTHCYDGLGMLVEQAAETFYIWRRQQVETKAVLHELQRLSCC